MESKQTVIQVKDLSKTFSNGSVQQHVLKNLNLSIYKGDFMDRPSLGTVTYYTADGDKTKETEISKYNNDKLALFRRNHVGFVFQQNYLNDSMSALDNIMVCGLLKHSNR